MSPDLCTRRKTQVLVDQATRGKIAIILRKMVAVHRQICKLTLTQWSLVTKPQMAMSLRQAKINSKVAWHLIKRNLSALSRQPSIRTSLSSRLAKCGFHPLAEQVQLQIRIPTQIHCKSIKHCTHKEEVLDRQGSSSIWKAICRKIPILRRKELRRSKGHVKLKNSLTLTINREIMPLLMLKLLILVRQWASTKSMKELEQFMKTSTTWFKIKKRSKIASDNHTLSKSRKTWTTSQFSP